MTGDASSPQSSILRIAMWSGPRNISTAMMRSFENRGDTLVCDEPFYAHYLLDTGLDHPGRDEILDHHETDPDRVIGSLLEDLPSGKSVFYQKHMAQHMIEGIDRSWFDRVEHGFLIRDPADVVVSFTRKFPEVQVKDTGLPQQVEIFRRLREERDTVPPVVDSRDVLQDPKGILGKLCEAFSIDFPATMLSWPPGPRKSDGIWAKYWYPEVEKTTSFQPPRPRLAEVPEKWRGVVEECRPYYEELYAHRLTV